MKRNYSIEEDESKDQNPIIGFSSCSTNNGVQWQRRRLVGKGSFGSVFMASLKRSVSKFSIFPPIMAVKSAEISDSETLQKEKQTYDNLGRCNSLIKCFGEEITTDDNGRMIYNLLLEFAAGGTLADQIKNTGGKGLPENEVRSYTRSIIKGLIHIHKSQYVHCDLKPANILLMPRNTVEGGGFVAKIGDLGLARRMSKTKRYYCLGGTLMYMAPETLIHNVQESPSDIWALGCLVLEMLTGNRPWAATNKVRIVKDITDEYGAPKIPEGISTEASRFLKSCFVRKPEFRFTAEMLMFVPFVAGAADEGDFLTAPKVQEKSSSKRQRVLPIQAVCEITNGSDVDHEESKFSEVPALLQCKDRGC